ncbi:MAG TPA: nucleotidyl transferase AbiEii/AbiGii toxin family protein [Bacteroidales bacterium]|nr:nucleotidyl transferase AbiEii/AbiGii toxin family protein [Bacteroidales bacterium]HSA42255.1 nucleotidyl transferase AbiEii/AbiGii toxin family protein [Bacteroidales bacterium]
MISLQEIIRQYPQDIRKPEFYDQMVKEYFHHHMLQSLFTGRFAGKIDFLGGTALRFFYNLTRFSEDLDFDCFDLIKAEFLEMTTKVEKDLQASGIDVFIEDKKRNVELKAFRRVFVFPELKYNMGMSQQKEARFFIKIEAEPHNFTYQPEIKTMNGFGITCPVRTVPLDILFSSKIAAALNRKKDRDFFDVVHLINFARPNFEYLVSKCRIHNPSELKESLLKAANDKRLNTRTVYDCEHMLFDSKDIQKIKNFIPYIENFNFQK